ncbi:MAG: hypothetical protein K6E32_04915 [Lachnospiraceae bacterium]|nr:hypothetical protein [Lachnospiraceae bacterium]
MSKYADGLKLGNIEGTFMRDFFALCRQGKQAVLDFVNDPEGGLTAIQADFLYELAEIKFKFKDNTKISDVDLDTFCSGTPLEIAFSDEIADLKQGRIDRDLAMYGAPKNVDMKRINRDRLAVLYEIADRENKS